MNNNTFLHLPSMLPVRDNDRTRNRDSNAILHQDQQEREEQETKKASGHKRMNVVSRCAQDLLHFSSKVFREEQTIHVL